MLVKSLSLQHVLHNHRRLRGSGWQEPRWGVTRSGNSRQVRSALFFVMSVEAMFNASVRNPLGLQNGVILFL